MVVVLASSSLPLSVYHSTAAPPFPSATTPARLRRRGRSLRLAAASRCSGPAAAPSVSAPQVRGPTAASALHRRRCDCFDLHNQIVPYTDAWAWQKSVVAKRKALVDRDEDFSDTVIALQHPPVYTLGTGNSEEYLRFDVEDPPFEVHRVDRGGQVTYHGPGQLVLYPFLNLHYHLKDLEWYQRALEEVIIRALKSSFSIKASRIGGLTGVWVGDRKVAAIGVYGSKWITYHGLALNVTTDLTPFEMIVPCGIKDYGVVSIKEILQDASDGREMDDTELMDIAYKSLIQEFAEFFNLSLECRPDWSLQENSSLN